MTEYWQQGTFKDTDVPLEDYLQSRMHYSVWRMSPKGVQFVQRKLKKQMNQCFYCRKKIGTRSCHVDHVKPLWKGGKNHHTNFVLACPSCNIRKGANNPYINVIQDNRISMAEERRDMELATKIAKRMDRWDVL